MWLKNDEHKKIYLSKFQDKELMNNVIRKEIHNKIQILCPNPTCEPGSIDEELESTRYH